MQPHDQDELRKKAQEVLARRISMAPDARPEAPRQAERPRQTTQNPRRALQSEQPRRTRTEPRPMRPVPGPMRSESRPVFELPDTEPEPRRMEPVAPGPMLDEPSVARTERRARAVDDLTIRVSRSSSYRRTSGPMRGQIHRALHDQESIRQAVLIAEILGKPVALREQDESETFGVL